MGNERFVLIKKELLLDRNVLNFLDFLFYRTDFNFLFRDYFLVVFYDFLHSDIIFLDYLSRNCLNDFTLFIVDYFFSSWYKFFVGTSFVFDYFFLIGDILNSALS